MPKSSSTTTKLAEHVARLVELRETAAARLAITTEDYEAMRADNGDVGAGDDEGGGESDVTSTERDRLRAAILVETQALEALDDALLRSKLDNWDKCGSCGGPIGVDRLEALPSAELCVSCKANSNSW